MTIPAYRRRWDADLALQIAHLRHGAEVGVVNYGMAPPDALIPHTLEHSGYGIRMIFTRDAGHHSGGWFKNPDYERCYHLSLSFRGGFEEAEHGLPAPKNWKQTRRILPMFFEHDVRWLWCEPPFSAIGRRLDVWHYRLFCDQAWQPIKPRGEVYSTDLTEAGWKSYSDLHGEAARYVMDSG